MKGVKACCRRRPNAGRCFHDCEELLPRSVPGELNATLYDRIWALASRPDASRDANGTTVSLTRSSNAIRIGLSSSTTCSVARIRPRRYRMRRQDAYPPYRSLSRFCRDASVPLLFILHPWRSNPTTHPLTAAQSGRPARGHYPHPCPPPLTLPRHELHRRVDLLADAFPIR